MTSLFHPAGSVDTRQEGIHSSESTTQHSWIPQFPSGNLISRHFKTALIRFFVIKAPHFASSHVKSGILMNEIFRGEIVWQNISCDWWIVANCISDIKAEFMRITRNLIWDSPLYCLLGSDDAFFSVLHEAFHGLDDDRRGKKTWINEKLMVSHLEKEIPWSTQHQ